MSYCKGMPALPVAVEAGESRLSQDQHDAVMASFCSSEFQPAAHHIGQLEHRFQTRAEKSGGCAGSWQAQCAGPRSMNTCSCLPEVSRQGLLGKILLLQVLYGHETDQLSILPQQRLHEGPAWAEDPWGLYEQHLSQPLGIVSEEDIDLHHARALSQHWLLLNSLRPPVSHASDEHLDTGGSEHASPAT